MTAPYIIMRNTMTRHLYWFLPLLALAFFAPFSADIDLEVSRYFFHGDEFTEDRFTEFMFKWGNLPGQLLGGSAVLLWMATCFTKRWQQWRKAAAAVALAFIIGPGILVNGVFKEVWGRPRPREITEFGGKHTFRPFYHPDFSENGYGNKSFPSGHVSMGFFFLTLALVARRENLSNLSYIGFFIAFEMGLLLALARIAQGGHYFSDCLFAAILMWWLTMASCRFIYGPYSAKQLVVT
ncbi:MAG: phosphatase PAP2 family protein [Nitrosomonas sp.]|nr:MAG: phosphatase PAP2 family protein [Nitrosomonas sp.]